MKRLWLSVLAVVMLVTGCAREQDDGTGYLFSTTLPENPECIDPQYTNNANAEIVIETIMEGLVRLDEKGEIQPAGAEEYTISEDGLHYEFKLRNDCYWFQAGQEEKEAKPVTALDYVYAFRRLLAPETRSPRAEEYFCLKNAQAVRNGEKPPEQLGISAPDGGSVIFDLEYAESDFLYLLAQSCAVPCNEDFFLSTNGRYGLDEETILCNGAFCLSQWVYDDYGSGNFLTFTKNNMYYDKEKISPSGLQFNIMRSQQEADEDFAEGNADILLTDTYPAKYLNSEKYTVTSHCTKTIGLLCNLENAILQNEKFRQALAYSINRESYSERLSGNLQPASGIIPPAVQLSGRSFRELYADEPLVPEYAPEKAWDIFHEVMPELPIQELNEVKILVPETFSDKQTLLAICQEWQNVSEHYIGIEVVPMSEYRERIENGTYSIALYTLETPRNSCNAAIRNAEQELNIETHFTLNGTENLQQTVEIYGTAEKELLTGNQFIPLFYQNLYLICTAKNQQIYARPFSRSIDFRKAQHYS